MHKIPLGRPVAYPQAYAPEVLFPIARADSRPWLPSAEELPFRGEDIWNAWELSWLDQSGKPVVATACIRIAADSTNLIESKSLKLYLNSLSNSRYAAARQLQEILARDLSAAACGQVDVTITTADDSTSGEIGAFAGTCIDSLDIDRVVDQPDSNLLTAQEEDICAEELYSHLLRSNCPITDQPDTGSILIKYEGGRIDRQGLLKYLVSYRNHNAFHEACVEQIFLHIKTQCMPTKLTVYARYNRRGGLDINPFRSDYEDAAVNLRLWRQ
jgi:7-cyano-7-deazaguanine reductase